MDMTALPSGPPGSPFFCVGAQKAGTTTLHAALALQGAVRLPAVKETKFFVEPTLYERGAEWYLKNHFVSLRPDEQIWGEVDPDCLFFSESAARIARLYPSARIVVLLRNPVERAWSHYLMSVRRGLEKQSFADALVAEADKLGSPNRKTRARFSYASRGHYLNQLTEFLNWFPRESLHVELFEEFVTDPLPVLARIQNFIGAPPPPADLVLPRENVGARARSALVARLLELDWPGRSRLRYMVGRHVRPLLGRVRRRNTTAFGRKPTMDAETRKRLVSRYISEIPELERLVGLDLRSWLDHQSPVHR